MTNTPQERREPEPATEVLITPDALQDRLMEAYKAGCYAVHEHYQPDPDPDFTEAAWDYVAGLDFTEDTRPHRALPAPPPAEEAVKKALGLAMAALQTIQGMEPITHEITLPTVMAQHAVDALNEIKALGATSCPNPCGECRGVVRVGKCDSCGWETHYEMAAHSHQPDLSRRVDRAAPDRGVAEGDRAVKDLLNTIADFLEDEADNRAAAGSEMSDYEREPRELAERVRQAISAPPAPVAGGWRDISTAPKDGTPILAWCVHPHARHAADDKEWCAAVVTQWTTFNGGGWTWYGPVGRFTHWMPLPAPPSADPVPVGGDEHPTPDAAGELAEALSALRPFALLGELIEGETTGFCDADEFDLYVEEHLFARLKVGDFRRVAQAASRLRSQGSE